MELQGKGFKLRNWQLTDGPALQEHADNINVACWLPEHFPSPYTLANAEFFINLKINDKPATNFPIVIDGKVHGVIGIDNFGDEKPLLGYWLSEQCWGKGITTAAVKLFTNYAFDNLAVKRLYADVAGNNAASMRVLEKAGYTNVEVLKNALNLRGKISDKHIFTCVA